MILKVLVVLAVAGAAWLVTRYVRRAALIANDRSRSAAQQGPMNIAQAAAVLGIAQDSDSDAVREAHRRLIAANHPDRGGSDYLAQQINQARDILINAEHNRRRGP